jgi:acyl carrier protein
LTGQELEQELKGLIVEALMLQDVKAEQIESDAPLFVEGLALDSIDALELAMALEHRWGVKFGADEEENRRTFASVRSLAAYIQSKAPSLVSDGRTAP